MPTVLWVAIGGGLGAALRYNVNVLSGRMFGADFPWHTLLVNILGCLTMGILIPVLSQKLNADLNTRAFLTTGVLGGFTTFSAFALDFAVLIERKAHMLAFVYATGSVVLSLVAVFAGLAIARSFAT